MSARRSWQEAGAIWVVSRVPLLLATGLATLLLPGRPGSVWTFSPTRPRNPFALGDSLWYIDNALRGYGPAGELTPNFAFFPLYPLSIRALRWLGLGMWKSGLLVSNLSFLILLWALLELGRSRLGEQAARRGTLYLAVFPFSYFFSHLYAESLFLALTLAAFVAADRGKWAGCAGLGFLAALTRPQGILLVIPLGIWALSAVLGKDAEEHPPSSPASYARRVLRPAAYGPALAMIGPAAGLGLFALYAFRRTGDPLAWLHAHQQWSYELGTTPWRGYVAFGQKLWRMGLYESLVSIPYGVVELVGALLAVVFVVLLIPVARHLGIAYAAWAAAVILIPMSSGSWDALGRYCSVMFPVFLVMGRWGNRTVANLIVVGSATLLGLLGALFASGYPFT